MLIVLAALVSALLAARIYLVLRKNPAPDPRGEHVLADLVAELRGLRDDLKDARLTRAANEAAGKFAAQQARRITIPAPLVEDDDEKTNVVTFPKPVDGSPPRYARRPLPAEPLADPDLVGTEDAADEAAAKLGPDEKTPPRGRRALLPVFTDPTEGDAS